MHEFETSLRPIMAKILTAMVHRDTDQIPAFMEEMKEKYRTMAENYPSQVDLIEEAYMVVVSDVVAFFDTWRVESLKRRLPEAAIEEAAFVIRSLAEVCVTANAHVDAELMILEVETPYVSEEWFDIVENDAKEAKAGSIFENEIKAYKSEFEKLSIDGIDNVESLIEVLSALCSDILYMFNSNHAMEKIWKITEDSPAVRTLTNECMNYEYTRFLKRFEDKYEEKRIFEALTEDCNEEETLHIHKLVHEMENLIAA